MDNLSFNPDFFTEQLEQMLSRLRNEIEVAVPASGSDLEDLDSYLSELNSFYYRSFNQRIFPLYKSSLQDEVTRLLRIHTQEDMIKKDIMANIKRYANLYNHVKNVLSVLREAREQAGTALFAASREQDRRALDLLYSLKRLQAGFIVLADMSAGITGWLEEKELAGLLPQHPAAPALLQLIPFLRENQDNYSLNDALNRLLVYLGYVAKGLSRLQSHPESYKQKITVLEDIKVKTPQFLAPDECRPLVDFFETHIGPPLTLRLNLLSYSLADGKEAREQNLPALEKWLGDFIYLLEKVSSGYFPIINGKTDSSNLAALQQLHKEAGSALQLLDRLCLDLSGAGEPDFSYFSNRTMQVLQPLLTTLKEAGRAKELSCFPELTKQVNQLELELSFLAARIDFLHQKQEHNNEVVKLFLNMVNMLDNYLNTLANSRADLERVLAPRNISRFWKEVAVKVERIPLEKGQLFPSEYDYLLNKHLVETRIVGEGQENNLILHEEGDIFIIRVDDLLEEELPYLVIAQKG